MLTKLPEWLKITQPNPTDDDVTKREASVNQLLQEARHSPEDLCALVAAAVDGVGSERPWENRIVPSVVEALREHQPSLPNDVKQIALEVQVCCLTLIGEILQGLDDDNSEDAPFIASASLCALGARPSSKRALLDRAHGELQSLAVATIERAARKLRQRRTPEVGQLESMQVPSDIAGFWKNLRPLLTELFETLDEAASADREELNLLWWFYAGRSSKSKAPLSEKSIHSAAVEVGFEVGELVRAPAPESVRSMVQKALASGQPADDLAVKFSLKQLATHLDQATAKALTEMTHAELPQFIDKFASVFPISWVCNRIAEGVSATAWAQEFAFKTGYKPTNKLTASEWSIQSFNERVTQMMSLQFADTE